MPTVLRNAYVLDTSVLPFTPLLALPLKVIMSTYFKLTWFLVPMVLRYLDGVHEFAGLGSSL